MKQDLVSVELCHEELTELLRGVVLRRAELDMLDPELVTRGARALIAEKRAVLGAAEEELRRALDMAAPAEV